MQLVEFFLLDPERVESWAKLKIDLSILISDRKIFALQNDDDHVSREGLFCGRKIHTNLLSIPLECSHELITNVALSTFSFSISCLKRRNENMGSYAEHLCRVKICDRPQGFSTTKFRWGFWREVGELSNENLAQTLSTMWQPTTESVWHLTWKFRFWRNFHIFHH